MTKFLTYLLLITFSLKLTAQKLPSKQTTNVWWINSLNINDNSNQWNTQFKAYQPVSRVFYLLANDDKNLYLTLGADDRFAIDKLLVGGVTFTVRPSVVEKGHPSSFNDVSITYPMQADSRKTESIQDISHLAISYTADHVSEKKIDSLRLSGNSKINSLFDKIGVVGIKTIQSPSIPMANAYNIKAKALFDANVRYLYKLMVPLSYLPDAIKNGEKFNYDIKLNGLPTKGTNGVSALHFNNPAASLPPDAMYLNYPTDFWNEYTLAKAP